MQYKIHEAYVVPREHLLLDGSSPNRAYYFDLDVYW